MADVELAWRNARSPYFRFRARTELSRAQSRLGQNDRRFYNGATLQRMIFLRIVIKRRALVEPSA
jgi:hypothetical protein